MRLNVIGWFWCAQLCSQVLTWFLFSLQTVSDLFLPSLYRLQFCNKARRSSDMIYFGFIFFITQKPAILSDFLHLQLFPPWNITAIPAQEGRWLKRSFSCDLWTAGPQEIAFCLIFTCQPPHVYLTLNITVKWWVIHPPSQYHPGNKCPKKGTCLIQMTSYNQQKWYLQIKVFIAKSFGILPNKWLYLAWWLNSPSEWLNVVDHSPFQTHLYTNVSEAWTLSTW